MKIPFATRLGIAAGLAALVLGATPAPAGTIELLGVAALDRAPFRETGPVGGLSGILYDPQAATYWAISDDRGEKGPYRIYGLKIDLSRGRLAEDGVRVVEVLQLCDAIGEPLGDRARTWRRPARGGSPGADPATER